MNPAALKLLPSAYVAAEIRADGLQVARVVHQHIGRQLRRLLDRHAAGEVGRVLVFGLARISVLGL